MSAFKEIIARVDERKPNSFSQRLKLQWLTALDGRIAADVFLMDIAEIRALPHGFPGAMDAEPLVGYPHDDLYDFWLEAKIHAANEEYSRYQNIMELYNESYNNFVRWFCSVYQPAKGGYACRSDHPTWFITAYGLAVKQGFRGSLDEWLASLKGEKGDTGKSAYQYALEAGYTGTEEAFREGQLNNGKTAYEYAVEGGYTGSVADFRTKMAAEYALKDHDHDGTYAKESHDHDGTYAKEGHGHDGTYAKEGHGHDGTYAKESHDHDGTYLKQEGGAMTGAVTLKGIVLTEGVDYGPTPPADPEVGRLFFIPVSEAVNL